MKIFRNVLLTGSLLFPLAGLPLANACRTVSRHSVQIAGEEALIVYDEKTHTERFIRQARFRTADADFGFLVPTPTVPKLSAASPLVFTVLRQAMAPQVIHRGKRLEFYDADVKARAKRGAGKQDRFALSGITVASEARIGDLDAVVLRARDTAAINEWLKRHQYGNSPELAALLAPYIRRGWSITVFRVAREVANRYRSGSHGTQGIIDLQPVQLTFQTPKAFYPYREGADAERSDGRRLRIFYLGNERVSGGLGEDATSRLEGWHATMAQSHPLKDYPRESIAAGIDVPVGEVGRWLTVFEDETALRPPVELYFYRSPDQSVQRPVFYEPEIIAIPVSGWMYLLAFLIAVMGIIYGTLCGFRYVVRHARRGA